MWDHSVRQRYTENAIVAVKFTRFIAFQPRKILRTLIIFSFLFIFVFVCTNFNLRVYLTTHYLNHGNSLTSYIEKNSFISVENYDARQLQQDKAYISWINETVFPPQNNTGSSATLNGIPDCPAVSNLLGK